MYEMAVYFENDQIESVLKAEIKSAELDPMLHPNGVAIVYFDISFETVRKARKILIDSFQLDSLAEYVGIQAMIRDLLEQALYSEYISRLESKSSMQLADIWNVAKVVSISFSKPLVWSKSDQAKCFVAPVEPPDKTSDKHLQMTNAGLNESSAKSTFIVEVDAPWDRSHGPKLAYFENGVLDRLACISG